MLVSVGDMCDRGPNSTKVYNFTKEMVEAGYMLAVKGNHCDKLQRYCMGRNVKTNHGLHLTIEEIHRNNIPKPQIEKFIGNLPYYLVLDDGKLIIAHAAFKESLLNLSPFDKKCRTWCLYGPTTGKTLPNGLPDRIDWAADRETNENSPIIIHGHQPYKEVRIINKVYSIDTGCVFGGKLTCLKYPEMKIIQVDALKEYAKSNGWGDNNSVKKHKER